MTQIKKPAHCVFDAPVMAPFGRAPRISRRFIYTDAAACGVTRADIRDAIANDSAGSKVLFRCEENTVNAAAVRAGTFNAIAMPRVIPSAFERFFCEKTPAFL